MRFKCFLQPFLYSAVALFVATTTAQNNADPLRTWEDILFAKSVDYGAYACPGVNRKIVAEFFKKNPLKRVLGVCHNNCAVVTSFSMKPLPIYDKQVLGDGFIAIHVLANRNGVPIYSRVLNGHSVVRKILQNRACNATFSPTRQDTKPRQRVLTLCLGGNCSVAQAVQE